MKINETAAHYIGLFSGLGLMTLFAFLGWTLAEHSDWFANVWASGPSRLVIIIGGALGAVWALAFTYSYLYGKRMLIRTFKKVVRSTVSECIDGDIVRVQGELNLLSHSLTAPLSKRQCSAYSIRASKIIDRMTTRAGGGHVSSESAWETFQYIEVASDFLIRCGDHFALVRSSDAKIIIQPDMIHDESSYSKDRGGFLTDEENTKRKQTLDAMGLYSNQYVGIYAADVKFEEAVLEPGEQVAVLGRGHWINTAASQEFHFLNERGIVKVFELAVDPTQGLFISDSNDVLEQYT